MPSDFPNPHDRFFKELFSEPETIIDFVRYYLPPEITAAIDVATLEVVKDSFIDEELRQYFSDLLLRMKLKNGGEAFIYVLLEHKSEPDEFVALQLLLYLARIWQPSLRAKTKPLPLVFPVVFYHGKDDWTVSREFNALFDFTGLEPLREYAVGLKYYLCDLSKIEITEGGPRLMAGLKTLKYYFSRELPTRLVEIFTALKPLPDARISEYIKTILSYFLGGKRPVSVEDLTAGVKTAFPEKERELMQTFADTWIQEGELRGELRGKQQGWQEEAAKMALRLTHRRVGILEAELSEQIRSLPTEQLENLSEAAIDFTSKSDLLTWLDNATRSEAQELTIEP